MSYAIVRNEKHTQGKTQRSDVHNERKSKNHSNKDIEINKTHLNYHLKKPQDTYVKEFQRMKKENDIKGQIRSNSNITCEYIVTSDRQFFDTIGEEESKRYFEESYKFLCNYNKLEEKYVISAIVHMDEGDPHMHFTYVPVIQTKDKQDHNINKLSCRDFWKGRNSYRELQDRFYENITSKGFNLERGEPSEITKRQHYTVEEYKRITNYENTKQLLKDITLELPETPNIKEIKRFTIDRDDKILKEIIEPKDSLIKDLYTENVELHKELSKQTNIIDKAEKFEKEQDILLAENRKLKNQYSDIEKTYTKKIENIEKEFEDKTYEIKKIAYKDYSKLEKENRYLIKIISTIKDTAYKFITWICQKFDINTEVAIRNFEKENNVYLDPEKQLQKEKYEKELEWER